MGTRNLTFVSHEGQYKVAQYGQWDGYPGGQGRTVLEFLTKHLVGKPKARAAFINRLNKLTYPTPEQIKQGYKDAGAEDSEWVSWDVANRFKAAHPSLNRDMGAEILDHIRTSKEAVPIRLDTDFAADSLFCEWAYVVDLDKNVLEVYKGFNQNPLEPSDRFYDLTEGRQNKKYHPVKLVTSFSLDELPTQSEFIAKLDPPEEEE